MVYALAPPLFIKYIIVVSVGVHRGVFGVDSPSTTTLLATSRPEGRDLIGLDEPEDEILKQPGENLPVHGGKGRAC